MRDTDIQKKATSEARRRWPKFFGFAVAALLILWLLGFPVYTRRPYTCAACRLDRTQHSLLGLRWSTFEESECSRWYAANVERTHEHVWARGGCGIASGIPSLFVNICIIGPAVTMLSKSLQVEIYQHFQDRLEAKRLFLRLGSYHDKDGGRLYEALLGWVEAGYPGTWAEWWATHREVNLTVPATEIGPVGKGAGKVPRPIGTGNDLLNN